MTEITPRDMLVELRAIIRESSPIIRESPPPGRIMSDRRYAILRALEELLSVAIGPDVRLPPEL